MLGTNHNIEGLDPEINPYLVCNTPLSYSYKDKKLTILLTQCKEIEIPHARFMA